AVLGPVRPTASPPGAAGLGDAQAAEWTQRANLPVYWLGCLGPADLDTVQARYAQGVAAIRAYWPD
ncbi:MAG: thiamine phosphate synthase, partial [Myxococcota bacterium]